MTEKKLIGLLAVIAGAVVALILTKLLFNRVVKKNNNLHTRFLIQMIRLVIIVGAIINGVGVVSDSISLGTLFFRSSALAVAIIGFAAQPVIADLISGYLISINKPFEIGDRIEVEGQVPGIVEDITLRHTVLRIYDGIRIIIPNSQLNSKVIKNSSYKQERRGLHLQYSVSYDTDVQKAMDKALKLHNHEVMSDTASNVAVFSIDEIDQTPSEGFGFVVTKGAVSTNFLNIINTRQPQAKYNAKTGDLWLTSCAMSGTGVNVEKLYQIRFQEDGKAYIKNEINPYAVQQELLQRIGYTIDGENVTI